MAVLWAVTGLDASFPPTLSRESPSDQHEKALPQGASVRLGSLAFRSATGGLIAFHPDGKKLAMVNHDSIQMWDLDRGSTVEARFTFDKSQKSPSELRFVKLDISPDGKFLAAVTATDRNLSSDEKFQLPNYQLSIWNTATRSQVAFIERTSALFSFCDSDHFARVGDGKVKLFRIADGTIVKELPTSAEVSEIRSMAYLPGRKEIVTGHEKGQLVFREIENGRQTQMIDASQHAIRSLSASADGKFVVADHEGAATCAVWDVNSGKKLGVFDRGTFQAGTLSPDGKTLIADVVSDVGTGKVLFKLDTPGRTPLHIPDFRFTPDGKRIAAHVGAAVVFWDARTGKRVDRTEGHEAAVTQVAFSPSGKQIASASLDGTVRIWDVTTAKGISRFDGTHAYNSFAWSPDGRLFAHASGRTTWLYDSQSGKAVHRLKKDVEIIGCTLTAVSFSANGKQLVTAAVGEVRWWDVATGASQGQVFNDLINCWAALLSDANQVGFAGSQIDIEGNIMGLWNIKEKRLARKFGDGRASLIACMLTPNEKHLLVSTGKGILLFDVVMGQETKPFGDDIANCIAIDSRGATVAFCRGGRVQVWDFATKKRLVEFDVRQHSISSIAFSPDGQTLITGGVDSTILLWRVADIIANEKGK
jgi:WD40 repeat protein